MNFLESQFPESECPLNFRVLCANSSEAEVDSDVAAVPLGDIELESQRPLVFVKP